MLQRPLLLPVETLSREFDGKLLLALFATERGWQTIVGKRSMIHDNIHKFAPSIFFAKDFRAGNRAMFQILSGLGHVIVGLDEEGLIEFSEELRLMKMDPEVIGYLDAAFAWGEADARAYRLADGMAGKPVIVTGNPRVDLLRPELEPFIAEEAARIRERFGNFALFNTNFSMVNHFIRGFTRFRVAEWVPDSKADRMKRQLLAHKARLLEAFLKLIPELSRALHPYPLVIRPHPSEVRQTWVRAADGLKNVHVLNEGNVAAWLRAADVLIHNGCTSAVEAFILGTPALAYRPVIEQGCDLELPNDLSAQLETADELIAAVVELVGKPHDGRDRLDPKRQALLDAHVAATTGPLACVRLMDEIEKRAKMASPPSHLPRRISAQVRHALRRSYRRIAKRSLTAKGNHAYLSHKFPPISLSVVNDRIGRVSRALDRFEGLVAEEVMPDVFRIT